MLLRSAAVVLVFGVTIGCDAGETPVPVQDLPEGMVYVPGGVVRIGDERVPEERPVFEERVRPFYMDANLVTVGDYRRFVVATGYRTDAEKFGSAAVYDPKADTWQLVAGAMWRLPLGPGAPPAQENHPVTQVSWNDAVAYAVWAGKRLPTEIEWEHAARGARNQRQPYAWGDNLVANGRHHANTWQHEGPADGHLFTSPVGSFGTTPLGLADMGGNVWQWTADWFRPYAERASNYVPSPQSERAQRGGSFLCNPEFCHGYRVSARSHSTPESALFHVGFRLVKDVSGS
jgi:sulfatase modifying factor 1